MLEDLPGTAFEVERLQEILSLQPKVEDWRIGEAFAEAYLVDHCGCDFPWPTGRDLKNPNASPAGTDLVGFQSFEDGVRFAFGEAKTSPKDEWPPSVMAGRHGIQGQLERLYLSTGVKSQLVRYLGLHAEGTSWLPRFREASKRYLGDSDDVALYGVLIRDVEPKKRDLTARAKGLSRNKPERTAIQLRAIYLPQGSIESLEGRALQARGGHQ